MMFTQGFYGHSYFQLVSGSGDTAALTLDALDARMRQAFEVYSPQFAAIDPNGYVQTRSDVLGVLAVVAAAVPKIETLRATIAEQTPKFAMKLIDELRELTLAIAYTQGQYEQQTGAHDDLSRALGEAQHTRESFLVALEALADRGFASHEKLVDVKRGIGPADTANDLEVLTSMLREVWPTVGLRTLIEWNELAKADAIVAQLRGLIDQRAKAAADVVAVARTRQSAFTVLVRRWNEVRRVVTYLRWHEDDVDAIAPSLWARARAGKRGEEEKKMNEQGGGETGSSEKGDGIGSEQSGGGNGKGNLGGEKVNVGGEERSEPAEVKSVPAVGNPNAKDAFGGGMEPLVLAKVDADRRDAEQNAKGGAP